MEDWTPVEVFDTKVYVTSDGRVQTWNGKEYVERNHYLNHDGYPVVSINLWDENGKRKKSRSVGIHRLIAMAFVANPLNKPEVNHKDFDRTNFSIENLEWVTHQENIEYSHKANRYTGKFGELNPNFGNNTLHKRYLEDKDYAKEKQSRPRAQNGRAKRCYIGEGNCAYVMAFDCQRDAVDYLLEHECIKPLKNKESIIMRLKRPEGYYNWHLQQI